MRKELAFLLVSSCLSEKEKEEKSVLPLKMENIPVKRFFFDRQDEANKNAESFPTYRIVAFEV